MLKRFRIEVEAATAEAAVEELWKYEHAIQLAEARRYGLGRTDTEVSRNQLLVWGHPVLERSFFNEELGRVQTEEVIEFDLTLPGYRARRVVQFNRLDLRDPLRDLAPDVLPGVEPVEPLWVAPAERYPNEQVVDKHAAGTV